MKNLLITTTIFTFLYINKLNSQVSILTSLSATDSSCDGFAVIKPNSETIIGTWFWTNNNGDTIEKTKYVVNNLCLGNYNLHYNQTYPTAYSNIYSFTISQMSVSNPCYSSNLTGTLTNTIKANYHINSQSNTNLINGVLTANISGGVEPINYYWSNKNYNFPVAMLLDSGSYKLAVIDSLGCGILIQNSVLLDTNSIDLNCADAPPIAPTDPTYSFCNGSLNVLSSNLNEPVNYYWCTGDTLNNIQNLCSNVYDLSIIDNIGCTYIYSLTLSGNLDAFVIPNHVSADGICDGKASTLVFGGSPPYNYHYSNNESTYEATSLCQGIQSVMITDAANDTLNLNFIIPNPLNTFFNNHYIDSTIIDTLYSTPIENCNINYSTIDSVYLSYLGFIDSTTITTIWTVIYSNDSIEYINQNYVCLNSSVGVYTLGIQIYCSQKSIGNNYLSSTDQYFIDKSTLDVDKLKINEKNIIYPNPFQNYIEIELENEMPAIISIADVLGKIIYNNNYTSKNIHIDLQNLVKGQYFLTISNKNGISTYKIIK